MPDSYELKGKAYIDDNGKKHGFVPGICWWTNLEITKRYDTLNLQGNYYIEKLYPKYDNYDAIEVSKVANIPCDYNGVMGVPISFLDKYNPNQFEILGVTQSWCGIASKIYPRQVQIDKSGKRKQVTKLNDGPAIRIDKPPINKTYYEVDGEMFIGICSHSYS